jgi:alpha-galactosidase
MHDQGPGANSHLSQSSTPRTAISRRSFLGKAAATTAFLGAPAGLVAQQKATTHSSRGAASAFLDLLRAPDGVTAYAQLSEPFPLTRSGTEWNGHGIDLKTRIADNEVAIDVHAPGIAIRYIHVRWSIPVPTSLLVLGDHWERSYGDLGWRNIIPERVLPWYFATWDGHTCHAYGVKTQPRSLCFWQLDSDGVSLWLNLSNGGSGVKLGQRTLTAATIVTRRGTPGEEAAGALRSFCHQMCAQPTRKFQPVYGTNDWYYAYGNNTAEQILDDTDFIAGLSAANKVQPFSVIDMGWAAGPPTFPSMPDLANQIKARKVRPGIWIRPMEAPTSTDPGLLMSDLRFGEQKGRARELAYDPTVPEAQKKILAKVKQVVDWGFELVKHDFSTYDLLGRWGFEMGAEPTTAGWSLHDQSRTNAEVILDLYQSIRQSCHSDTVILGCNTIGHLGQGYFDIQRTGDDTSGRVWERTRRMGVNTLAFRLPQHQAFFVQDADCVGISAAIPWESNRQWLDLLAHSGTALFISPGESSRIAEHARAIREAFQLAANGGSGAKPSDAFQQSTPQRWTTNDKRHQAIARELRYDWFTTTGAFPFTV